MPSYCVDHTSSSDWLFGLWPGPPQRFEPTGADIEYQYVNADEWPAWGGHGDLYVGGSGAPRGGMAGRMPCSEGERRFGQRDSTGTMPGKFGEAEKSQHADHTNSPHELTQPCKHHGSLPAHPWGP